MGVSEIRRNKPTSGPSRSVPVRQPRITGAELRVANGAEAFGRRRARYQGLTETKGEEASSSRAREAPQRWIEMVLPPGAERSKPINIARGAPGNRQLRGDYARENKLISLTRLRGRRGPGVPRALGFRGRWKARPPKPKSEGGKANLECGLPGAGKEYGR